MKLLFKHQIGARRAEGAAAHRGRNEGEGKQRWRHFTDNTDQAAAHRYYAEAGNDYRGPFKPAGQEDINDRSGHCT